MPPLTMFRSRFQIPTHGIETPPECGAGHQEAASQRNRREFERSMFAGIPQISLSCTLTAVVEYHAKVELQSQTFSGGVA
jgi:hypothetical protein